MSFNETDFQSLVKNALDFLRKSMAELEEDPKYSVINFYSALELFLKARLMREHWSLCASDADKASKEQFAKGDFQSIGLKEAATRLKNIVNESLGDAEVAVYDTLRERRNQAVHFFHPSDLSDVPRVATEQLKGWHYLHHRLAHIWKDHFRPWLDELAELNRTMIRRADFYPAVFDDLSSVVAVRRKKGHLWAKCEWCSQDSAFVEGSPSAGIYRTRCIVCGDQHYACFLPCQKCQKPALRRFGESAHCQHCGNLNSSSFDETATFYAAKVLHQDSTTDIGTAYCGLCGYMPQKSVVTVGDLCWCLACLQVEDKYAIGSCHYCGEQATHEFGEPPGTPNCVRCGAYDFRSDEDPDPVYMNDHEHWQHSRLEHRFGEPPPRHSDHEQPRKLSSLS